MACRPQGNPKSSSSDGVPPELEVLGFCEFLRNRLEEEGGDFLYRSGWEELTLVAAGAGGGGVVVEIDGMTNVSFWITPCRVFP